VSWSDRISTGGFEYDGVHYPVAPNRVGEPYPIHGDGWLQPWTLSQSQVDVVEMRLTSAAFQGNPYAYQALQRFVPMEDAMDQTLAVTHIGARPLPYGLSQHPSFLRSASTRLTTSVRGVWLSGNEPLPMAHTTEFPESWDPRCGMDVNGTLIDTAYTGWSGETCISWPEHQFKRFRSWLASRSRSNLTRLALTMREPDICNRGQHDGLCLHYRPPVGPFFCFEPVIHAIDASHMPGIPGLRALHTGQSLTLTLEWRFGKTVSTM
jgi:aldose 1-epimerase